MSNINSKTLTKNKDMLSQNIAKCIIAFAIPLLIGNLFQQLYNMVDTYVIGQTGINEAYAAVGSVTPIINILIGTFSGLSMGASVVISHSYGANDMERLKKDVHTSVFITIILGILFTIVGILLVPVLLKLMLKATEDAIFYYAKTYLTIYFSGIFSLMVYNMGSSILRAVGDSLRPFYYLIVATIINISLDFIFVFYFNLGVKGVAFATIIAQTTSAILVVINLFATKTCVKVRVKDIKIDKQSLLKIIKIGFPSAIQMALTSFSNMFVQSYIASVDGDKTHCLGGWTTFSKVDQFIFLPMQSIALSVMTFVGQNLGNNNLKRAKKGTLCGFLLALFSSVVLIIIVIALAPSVARIFNKDENVGYYATLFLRYITPFYVCSCINQVLSASMRGCGNSRTPMIIMLSTFVGVRQIYLYIMANYVSNSPLLIALGYPVGWVSCAIGTLICFIIYNYGQKKTNKNKATN